MWTTRAFLLAATALVLGCTASPENDRADRGGGDPTDSAGDTHPGYGDPGDDGQPPADALRMLFIGNSFTLGGPVPDIVDLLARDAGWPDPDVQYSAFNGETLEGHRARAATVALVDAGGWDVVVLQEFSTRPTDNLGDPPRFKLDATWFFDRIKAQSPDARVILYETWARHPDHEVYPTSFIDPAEMQAQLRLHYNDAANNYIPANATEPVVPAVTVAPVGDTWEAHLGEPNALRLHYTDNYHAGVNGQYLNGLVIYATIYERSVAGATSWSINPLDAARLQANTDAMTGFDVPGGPAGESRPTGLLPGERVQIDLGSDASPTTGGRWSNLTIAANGARGNVPTANGAPSSVDVVITVGFGGVNTDGVGGNAFAYPTTAAIDAFFCGSFDSHADGLTKPGQVTLASLDPSGVYTLRLFASRIGDDSGQGRLTRYGVGDLWADLEVADNTTAQAVLTDLVPTANGILVLDVAVSPVGTARFCYLGVLELERQ